jgi:hypothetical protein
VTTLALGWGRPLEGRVDGGWDWWALAGAIGLFLLIETARRRPPIAVAIALAALGGLVVGDLTEALGVVPVWGPILFFFLTRDLLRGRRSQV